MSKILGIDLGTTFSCMAIVEGGEPRVLENAEGSRTTPSVVAVTKNGERLVGILAKRQAVTNPRHTLYSVKRLIGRRFSDTTVQHDKKLLSYEIREASDGGVEIKMGDRWYRPQEISAMVLAKLKHDAEARLGEKITEAIVTCPAYFDDSQRKATKEAGEIAGFTVKRVINEPTAAALAYGLDKKKDQKIIVYDFGGGTFDISVLYISEDAIEVKATGGDTHLGGDDIDQRVMDWIVSEFKREQGIDLTKDELALQRLKEAAEKAKVELSSALETEINLPFITSDTSGPKHLYMKFTRAKLEDLTQDFIERSIMLVQETLKEAHLTVADIDEIVLVGGQTRMPAIREAVKKLFNKEPNISINPDEVVAVGAAIQGGILQGEVRDVLLLDVTPLSLGIETLGGVMTKIVEKNTTIPVQKTQVFSTASDNQTSVEVHVLQGERPMAQDNKSLGRFILDGIPPAPRGVPQIEVSFDIDVNGILNVHAKDRATGKSQSIRIEGSTGLSKEEVERLRKEAELYAEQDQKRQRLVETRNQADTVMYTTERMLKDLGEKISSSDKEKLEEKLASLRKVKDGEDREAIEKEMRELSDIAQQIGAALYQKTKQETPQEKEDTKEKRDASPEEPQEGEYEEKK